MSGLRDPAVAGCIWLGCTLSVCTDYADATLQCLVVSSTCTSLIPKVVSGICMEHGGNRARSVRSFCLACMPQELHVR